MRGDRRRGLLLASVLALVAFAVLVGLGKWQLDRKAWKDALIATLDRRLSAPAEPLPPDAAWDRLTPENSEFRRVAVRLEFLDRRHALLYTGGSALRADVKAPGYFVFVPARLPGGAVVAVNSGYVPERDYPRQVGPAAIVGYLRWPEAPSWFVAAHNVSGDTWFVRDHRAMARLRGWGDRIAPFYIEQESPVPPGGLPRPGPLTVKLRNDHLGYALTWFGLAGALAVVFVLWARRRWREG